MLAQPKPFITPDEYLALDREADRKSEYYQGQLYAMAGASNEHTLIVTNLVVELGTKLRERDCTVRASDMRLQVSAAGLYTYPDVSVVCGPADFRADAVLDTLLNPVLLVEVLSRSTSGNDRGSKFLYYRSIPSLEYYVLVDSRQLEVAVYSRAAAGTWLFQAFTDLTDVIMLPKLDLTLTVAEIYRQVPMGR